jgi:hypothetical protein
MRGANGRRNACAFQAQHKSDPHGTRPAWSTDMTTIGQLVSTLFANFDRQFHDEELAAVATQVALAELLSGRKRVPQRRGR